MRDDHLSPEQAAVVRESVTITGDGNVVGNDNTVNVVKLENGDYVIQAPKVTVTLSPTATGASSTACTGSTQGIPRSSDLTTTSVALLGSVVYGVFARHPNCLSTDTS